MCGIMGYIGDRPALDVLVKGLRRLEYRGYDSAGIAFSRGAGFEIVKSEGKLAKLEELLASTSQKGVTFGLGHTRWATHGKPTAQNAHPHKTGPVVLVHNGIIENYHAIRERCLAAGYEPKSETDSELYGFLVLDQLKRGEPFVSAVRKAFLELQGSCSVVVSSENEPGLLVGVRNGSPLVAAMDAAGGVFLASDAQALVEYSQQVVVLESGDYVIARKGKLEFFELATGRPVSRPPTEFNWSAEALDKNGFPHYMLKEIYDQPQALVDTLNSVLDRSDNEAFKLAEQPGKRLLEHAQRILLTACGTSLHSALLGKYWIEEMAGVIADVEVASELRYRTGVIGDQTCVIGISQSGETADTLAVLRDMRARNLSTLGITNVRGSSVAREAQAALFLAAGPEIGVAATKTFAAQNLVMLLVAGALARSRGREVPHEFREFFDEVLKLPHLVERTLSGSWRSDMARVAQTVADARGYFFVGRGYSYPVALEGALKLKEIAYVHAEGYPAGELKHGPIAMIDEDFVVVVIAPQDRWYDKSFSNLEEVRARGARLVGIGFEGDARLKEMCSGPRSSWIGLPKVSEKLTPFITGLAVQALSYEIAVLKGTDVDQPRNLAKSVTVE